MWSTLVLFLLYLSMAILFFKQSSFIRNIGLKPSIVIFLFVLKIVGGIFYSYVMNVRFYGGDSHVNYVEVFGHVQNLAKDWKWELHYFITGWSGFDLNAHYFSKANATALSDLGSQLNYRIMYISTILSFGNEMVNIIFYNFLFFIGQLALYKFFIQIAANKKIILLAIVFAIPSVWFWCSGIHKDGFILSLFGVLLLAMYNWKSTRKHKYFFVMILALMGLFCIRYYISLLILPIWICFLITVYYSKLASWKIYIGGFILFTILFFNIHHLITPLRPADMVVKKQLEFLQLKGNSFIAMDTMKPTLSNFIQVAPKALTRVLARPYITESKDLMYLITSIETILLLLIISILLFLKKQHHANKTFIHFCLITGFIMFLIIGYIIPFSGAFIRYRSAYYPIFIGALYCWGKFSFLEKIENKYENFIFR
jgi:hypothetical protein